MICLLRDLVGKHCVSHDNALHTRALSCDGHVQTVLVPPVRGTFAILIKAAPLLLLLSPSSPPEPVLQSPGGFCPMFARPIEIAKTPSGCPAWQILGDFWQSSRSRHFIGKKRHHSDCILPCSDLKARHPLSSQKRFRYSVANVVHTCFQPLNLWFVEDAHAVHDIPQCGRDPLVHSEPVTERLQPVPEGMAGPDRPWGASCSRSHPDPGGGSRRCFPMHSRRHNSSTSCDSSLISYSPSPSHFQSIRIAFAAALQLDG